MNITKKLQLPNASYESDCKHFASRHVSMIITLFGSDIKLDVQYNNSVVLVVYFILLPKKKCKDKKINDKKMAEREWKWKTCV